MIDGQTSELKLFALNLGDGGWELCQYIRFWTRFEPKLCPWLLELVVKCCMRHTFVGSVITMWSYNQNIMRLAYPGTKPIFTAWLIDFGSTLWLNYYWYWYICASESNPVFGGCEQDRHRPASASAQSDQRLCIAYWKVSYLDVLRAKI